MQFRAGSMVLFCAALAATSAADAQPASAEARIRHGNELRRLGRDEEALAEFRAAYSSTPAPRRPRRWASRSSRWGAG